MGCPRPRAQRSSIHHRRGELSPPRGRVHRSRSNFYPGSDEHTSYPRHHDLLLRNLLLRHVCVRVCSILAHAVRAALEASVASTWPGLPGIISGQSSPDGYHRAGRVLHGFRAIRSTKPDACPLVCGLDHLPWVDIPLLGFAHEVSPHWSISRCLEGNPSLREDERVRHSHSDLRPLRRVAKPSHPSDSVLVRPVLSSEVH